jgi:hypothetical protein
MTSKQAIPWARISVEAVAVIVSILLAFAIDAWWDERKERIEERKILQSLQIEFQANRDEAASVVRVHENALRFAAEMAVLSDSEILALAKDEVERHIRYFAHPRTFDAVRGSVDALTSAGKLGILQDRELREALTTFVNILEDAKEDREYMFEWAMIVWQEAAKVGGPYWMAAEDFTREECMEQPSRRGCDVSNSTIFLPHATSEDLLRFRNNSVLMGYVNRSHSNSARYMAEVQAAQVQIDIILELLDKSL